MIPKEHSPATPDSTHTSEPVCVLLVDDNDKVRDLLTMGLRTAGYSVIAAASEIDLQHHLATLTPAALILDLQRCQTEGLRLLTRMRARPRLQRTPILFLSGSDDELLRYNALAAGADFYGVRPLGVLELQKALDCLVRNGRLTTTHSLVRPPTRLDRLARLKRARRLSRTG